MAIVPSQNNLLSDSHGEHHSPRRSHCLRPALRSARRGSASGSRSRRISQPDGHASTCCLQQPYQRRLPLGWLSDCPRRLARLPAGIPAGKIQLEEPREPRTGNGQADRLRGASPVRSSSASGTASPGSGVGNVRWQPPERIRSAQTQSIGHVSPATGHLPALGIVPSRLWMRGRRRRRLPEERLSPKRGLLAGLGILSSSLRRVSFLCSCMP